MKLNQIVTTKCGNDEMLATVAHLHNPRRITLTVEMNSGYCRILTDEWTLRKDGYWYRKGYKRDWKIIKTKEIAHGHISN